MASCEVMPILHSAPCFVNSFLPCLRAGVCRGKPVQAVGFHLIRLAPRVRSGRATFPSRGRLNLSKTKRGTHDRRAFKTESENPREFSDSERKKETSDVELSGLLRNPRKRNGVSFF